ncbi:MAG: YsnF/AvaK domain-containing protein, partial [Planctomycetaceae bacterium]|nr:YsnF/AvaK domain-containing protein [Planctomycetaceae bacterium]
APTGEPGASDIRPGEELRIPVRKEQVTVEKRPVVKEEVTVGKRVVQRTEQVGGEVRKEVVRVEREGDVDIRGDGTARSERA